MARRERDAGTAVPWVAAGWGMWVPVATGISPVCGILKCVNRRKLKSQQMFLVVSINPFRFQQNVQVAETEEYEVLRRDESKYSAAENTVSKGRLNSGWHPKMYNESAWGSKYN